MNGLVGRVARIGTTVILLLAAGCTAPLFGPSGEALLQNLTVYSPPLRRNLVLRDGHYRDVAGNVHARLIKVVEGELDGRSGNDAVGVLEVINPAAGVFYQLVGVVTVDGRRQASALYVGKWVKLDMLAIEDGQVRMALRRPREGDRTCCPSLAVTERYRWQGGKLQEVAPTLVGARWELVELWGRPIKSEPVPHLTFGADQRALGFGGCNQLALDYQLKAQSIRFDGVGGGQKYCADTPEEDFVGALIQADRYGWKAGTLELYSGGEVLVRMRAGD